MTSEIKLRYYGQVNASRIGKMLESDRDKALYMGLWDRFKDVFRSCWGTSKQNRLVEIWGKLQDSVQQTEMHDEEVSLFASARNPANEQISGCNNVDLQAQIIEIIRKISIFHELRLLAEPNYANNFRVLVTRCSSFLL